MTTLEHTLRFLDPQLTKLKQSPSSPPLVLAVSGPQGSGKSYISDHLCRVIPTQHQLNTIVISLDDLYLKHEDQIKLDKQDNELLWGRGLPGTHEFALIELIKRLVKQDTSSGSVIELPLYDKSQFNGAGDRCPIGQKVQVTGDQAPRVIIVEGWFLGFLPLKVDEIKRRYENSELLQKYKLNSILEINKYLSRYLQLWDLVDVSVVYKTNDINNVIKWRTQQEHALIATKGSGMSDKEIKDFVARYMVCYELYYGNFIKKGLKRTFIIEVRDDRTVSAVYEI